MQKEKLLKQEDNLLQLKNNLNKQRDIDIKSEENNLDQVILDSELNTLQEELQKLHIEDTLDLQLYNLKNIEDLEKINKDKARKIEKELLKRKLKKALNSLEIPFILSLPFIRNKYFLYFASSLFVSKHLRFFDNTLKRKTEDFIKEDYNITHGSDAFSNCLVKTEENILYLNYLEKEAFLKYPDLILDSTYMKYLNRLKEKLLLQQQKLIKKEKMIKKYNLKLKKKIRKLIKRENQSF